MDSSKKIPCLEDLKSLSISNPELIFQVQSLAQKAYSKSLQHQKEALWFSNGYSLKPDSLEIGFQKYCDRIMKEGDKRNAYLYGELKKRLRMNLASWLGSSRPEDIALGSNATTFVVQLLTHFWGKTVKILTSDGEFYGIVRILNRLKEIEGNEITEVPVEPISTFHQRMFEQACQNKYDVVILSHVFFKTGNVLDDLDELAIKLKGVVPRVLIDGSGAFGNISVKESLGKIMDEIYYIGGIFKFVGSGEGFAFMSLPKDCSDRPLLTGWLFGDITDESQYYSNPTVYPTDGDRYVNSTLECSVWERTCEVMEYFDRENFTVELKNIYTQTMSEYFLKKIEEAKISFLPKKSLITHSGKWRALQNCFDFKDATITAQEVVKKLAEMKIYCDARGTILRICLPVYHTVFDLDNLVRALKTIDGCLGK